MSRGVVWYFFYKVFGGERGRDEVGEIGVCYGDRSRATSVEDLAEWVAFLRWEGLGDVIVDATKNCLGH